MRPVLTVLLAASLLLVPSTAARTDTTRHFLTMYRAEQTLGLDAHETRSTTLTCHGAFALDGVWVVGDVEGGGLSSVDVRESHGDASTPEEWHFTFHNSADGRAPVKVYALCLGRRTEASTHAHDIFVGHRHAFSQEISGDTVVVHATSCPGGEVAVAPGFGIDHGSAHLLGSYPTAGLRGWTWKVSSHGAHATFSLRCLRLKTAAADNHAHRIYEALRPGPRPAGAHELSPGTHDVQVACQDTEKAMVGAFWLGENTSFGGMAPRVKVRHYKIHNSADHAVTVHAAAVCINDQTGTPISP